MAMGTPWCVRRTHTGPSQANIRGGGLSQDGARLSAPATGQGSGSPSEGSGELQLPGKEGEQSPPQPPALKARRTLGSLRGLHQPGVLNRLSLLVFLIVP